MSMKVLRNYFKNRWDFQLFIFEMAKFEPIELTEMSTTSLES